MIAEDFKTSPQTSAANFYSELLSGNFDIVLDAFEGEPIIEAPRCGLVTGYKDVARFLREEKAWLESLGASIDKFQLIRSIASPERVVHEVSFQVQTPPTQHPIMFTNVSDIGISGITVMRIYYSFRFLNGNQSFDRKAMPPTEDSLIDSLPFPVHNYFDQMAGYESKV